MGVPTTRRSALRFRPPSLVAGVVFALTTTATSPATAQLSDNNYALDLFQGPILAPSRVISLGGAYAGLAEGIPGFVANAASPATRKDHSVTWVDWDISATLSVPLPFFSRHDFDNSGQNDDAYSDFIYLAGGALVQAGPFGTGLFADMQRYTLTTEGGAPTAVTIGRYQLLGAWHFLDDTFALGAGLRAVTLGISAPGTELTITGVAPQYGALVKPPWMPFRLGVTFRHPVPAGATIGVGANTDADGVERAGGLITPNLVELPWELEAGLAVQLGPRPLNPQWINPDAQERQLRQQYRSKVRQRQRRHRRLLASLPSENARRSARAKLHREEREARRQDKARMFREISHLKEERQRRAQNWPRERLLLTTELLVTGPVKNAVRLEHFLAQQQPSSTSHCVPIASGESSSISPRFGIEMEPVPMYLQTSFGSYFEPNRYRYTPAICDQRVGRQHFTFGANVKLFTTTWFGLAPKYSYALQLYGDIAPRYQSLGASLGLWH